jgi:hypothetical protein
MWSLICSWLLISCNICFLMLQLVFLTNNVSFHFSLSFACLLSLSTKLFSLILMSGKWWKISKWMKTIVHKCDHDKSMPLIFTSLDLLLFILRFCYLKHCVSCCHPVLDENECHPCPPSSCILFLFAQFISHISSSLLSSYLSLTLTSFRPS